MKVTKISGCEDIVKNIDRVVDGLGMTIDSKIKRLVLVLNKLKFETSASCEGYLDTGRPYPWIEFNVKDKNLDKGIEVQKDIQAQIKKLSDDLEIDGNYKKYKQMTHTPHKNIYAWSSYGR